MRYDSIVISSGHSKKVRGASDIIDEVDEARRVVEQLATDLRAAGVKVKTFHDDTSSTQNENLNTIVAYHNAQTRDLDVSVHFNAYEHTSKPMGTECLYITQPELAGEVADAIAACGLIDRGPKKRTDLFFLNNTEEPAILIEVCFVDSSADVDCYEKHFTDICAGIAGVLSGQEVQPGPSPIPPGPEVLFQAKGKCSHFGGPDDDGVSPTEGLAFISAISDAPQLFLPIQPPGTTGLARRLNPYVHYVACRWDYATTPKSMLRDGGPALVRSVADPSKALTAFPADWGPHQATGRVADLSPSLMADLGLATDDEVEVVYPWEE